MNQIDATDAQKSAVAKLAAQIVESAGKPLTCDDVRELVRAAKSNWPLLQVFTIFNGSNCTDGYLMAESESRAESIVETVLDADPETVEYLLADG